MICAVGIILPKWTMIYIFHVRTGFLRGWLIVLVWNNSSGNIFQNWLIHTLHGLSFGLFFPLSLCLIICVLCLLKLNSLFPFWVKSSWYLPKPYMERENICIYISVCIHTYMYIYIFKGEKKNWIYCKGSVYSLIKRWIVHQTHLLRCLFELKVNNCQNNYFLL